MDDKKMWENFLKEEPTLKNASYDAWQYGCAVDELADLTLRGIKTATASLYVSYEAENSPIPKVGDFSIILGSDNEALCIIKTSKVSIVPFAEVSEEQAYKEGEGDRSLDFWRKVHRRFFEEELAEIGEFFTENVLVVCEEFIKVYPKE